MSIAHKPQFKTMRLCLRTCQQIWNSMNKKLGTRIRNNQDRAIEVLFITIEIPCFFFSCDKLKRCLRAHLFFSSVRAAGRAVFVCDGTLHCAFNNYLYLQILTQLPCLFSESRVSVRLPHSVTCSVLTCCSHACVCEAVSSTGSMFYLVRSHILIW